VSWHGAIFTSDRPSELGSIRIVRAGDFRKWKPPRDKFLLYPRHRRAGKSPAVTMGQIKRNI